MTTRLEPIVNNRECEKTIAGSYLGVLVMCLDNTPYAVPMNHAYENGFLYFHCTTYGRKLEYIRKNPLVSYVIQKYGGAPEDFTKKCHAKWESVLLNGKAAIIEDQAEFNEAFKKFMNYYGKSDFKPSADTWQAARIIKVEITDMSARREHQPDVFDFFRWEKGHAGMAF